MLVILGSIPTYLIIFNTANLANLKGYHFYLMIVSGIS